MTTTLGKAATDSTAVEAATPTQLLARIRGERAAIDAADARLVGLALDWADAHPDLEEPVETDPDSEWFGLPNIRWDAAASFAAANHMSTAAGRGFLRDLLLIRHRLPGLHGRTVAGQVPVWRSRRIAQALIGQPDDVCTYVDQQVADRAETVGPITLDRIIDEAKLRLHAEERELEQLEALDARYVTVYEQSINHTGIADLQARADWADLAAFDEAVSAVAVALGRAGCPESLDVRRSMALGILADPERALALLAGTPTPGPKRRILLTYHLTDAALAGIDPVGFDIDGRPLLDQLVRQWCGRDDARLTIQPLLRVGGCVGEHEGHPVEDYPPSAADRLDVELRDRTCVHPYCTRPARHCDCEPSRLASSHLSPSTSSRSTPTTPTADQPAPATWPRCADITLRGSLRSHLSASTGSRPTPAGTTPSSSPAPTSGPTRTASSSSAPPTAPTTSPDVQVAGASLCHLLDTNNTSHADFFVSGV